MTNSALMAPLSHAHTNSRIAKGVASTKSDKREFGGDKDTPVKRNGIGLSICKTDENKSSNDSF